MLALLVAVASALHTGETDRVRAHLEHAHYVLTHTDVSSMSPALRAARARNIERLERYTRAGQYPHNDDHPDTYRPTFVDERGEICAVGALFASDRGYAAAVRVAKMHKYSFIVDIHDAELAAWQATSGLTPAELALIQPSYDAPPAAASRMWLPWGLTDRAQFGASRIAVSSETSSADNYNTMALTLHGQATFPHAKRTGFYLTMPVSVVVDDRETDIAAAGGTLERDTPHRWSGNGDVGIYFGTEQDDGATVFRLGALLPTATERPYALPSARAGDLVMELPRSYGGRFAASKLSGWSDSIMGGKRFAFRLDGGFDYARETENKNTIVVPRAAFGILMSADHTTMSFDAVVAHAYDTATGDGGLRFSTGTTIRLADRYGRSCGFQPAISVAAVRTPDGWGGALTLELAMAFAENTYSHDDDDDPNYAGD